MIELQVFKKLYGNHGEIELNLDLEFEKGDFISITGKSGSGKTTFLRILAGLEKSESNITVDGKVWQGKTEFLPSQKREIGFVFQNYALFPNMTVLENLLYVSSDKELANYLLEKTELKALSNKLPNILSGGQKQRLSLCRALMKKPKLLLMDEPLSALDPKMRLNLQNEILAFHKKFEMTIIMVSHDPSEIYRLSNRVLVLEDGKIINDGKPKNILLRTHGSSKFSFEGEILDIIKVDIIFVAIVSIGKQLVEIVISKSEVKELSIGQKIQISTKAFTPNISLL